MVDVAKSVQDNGGGTNLDSILDNADKADDLKFWWIKQFLQVVKKVRLTFFNVLDNAEKATELSEVVSSAG